MQFFKNIFIVSIFTLLSLLGYTQPAKALEFDPIAAQTSLSVYDDAHIKNLFGILLQNAIIMGDIQPGGQIISQPPLSQPSVQPAPPMTVIPPNPATGSSGATLLSATDLSSQRFVTDTATIKNLSVTSCTGCSSGGSLSGLTSGKIPVATSSNTLGDSIITQSVGGAKVDGHMAIGASSNVNDGSLFYLGATYKNLLSLQETITDLTSINYVEGITNYVNLNPASNGTAYTYGIDNEIEVQAGNTRNLPFVTLSSNYFTHKGTGTVNTVKIGDFQGYNSSTGTINSLRGGYFYLGNHSTGAINNGYGIYIESPDNYGGGTFANNYGVYINDQSAVGSANSYNLYSAGAMAKNYFQGQVGIGTGTPSSPLHVSASGAKTASFTGSTINNTATSSTTSIDKVGLSVSSTGTWNGSSANNYALKIEPTTGGARNWNIYSGTAPTSSYFSSNGVLNAPNYFSAINQTNSNYASSVFALNENNSTSLVSQIGLYGASVAQHASGTRANVYGVYGEGVVEGSGNIGKLMGVSGYTDHEGAGTVDIMASFYSWSHYRDIGTVSLNTGLYLADQSGVANTAANNYQIYSATSSPFVVRSDGNVGIGITNPTEPLDINSDNIRVRTSKTPATSGSTCDQGEISWDNGYVYVCTGTNTWKRSALSTW